MPRKLVRLTDEEFREALVTKKVRNRDRPQGEYDRIVAGIADGESARVALSGEKSTLALSLRLRHAAMRADRSIETRIVLNEVWIRLGPVGSWRDRRVRK